MPKDRASFEADIKELKACYAAIKDQCNTYLKSHRHTLTTTGAARKAMVKKQLAMAEIESRRLEERAEDIYKLVDGKEERPSWINILAEIRVERLDLHKDDPNIQIEKTGAAASQVLKVTMKNGEKSRTGYIKKMEIQDFTDAKMKEEYFNDEAMKDENRKMLSYIVNNILRPIEGMPTSLKDTTYVYKEVSEYLKEHGGYYSIMKKEGGAMDLVRTLKSRLRIMNLCINLIR